MSRVKMPHNNRMSSSTALKTNDIWSKTIGYDPYANNEEEADREKNSVQAESLLLLARISNLSGVESRGGCKRCGMLGHLTYQCRNPVQSEVGENESDSNSSSDEDSESEDPNARKRSSPLPSRQKEEEVRTRERKRKRDDSESSSDESGSHRKKSKKDKKHKKQKKLKKSKKHKKDKH